MNRPHDESAGRIRTVFDHALQFAGLLSPDGTLLETNPVSLSFIDATREDVVGRPFWDTPWWTFEEERGRVREEFRRAAAGERVRYEVRTADREGRERWFDFSLTPVIGADGAVTGVVAEGRDITDLHLAREGLERSEARLDAILGGVLDAIISIGEDQRIELFNRGAELMFGYARHEVLGQPLSMLIPPAFRAVHNEHVREFGNGPVDARIMAERGEVSGRRKDGELFPAEASIARHVVGSHQVYTAVVRDVTRRKEAEAELARLMEREKEARQAAEAAARGRDDMLRVVSHDLRNPVTGVLMGTRMLRRQLEEGDPALELVEGIEVAAERQRRLIRDLTDVAGIESGRLSIEPRALDPAALVRTAVRSFEPAAAQREIALEVEVDGELPPVMADHDRVVQVFANLLDNALTVTPEKGRVRVEATPIDGGVEFAVSDTGPGIAEADQARVFERFWRGEQGARRGGSGLGLAIARGIVEGHGGEIRVRSAPGRGAEFCFTLPAVASDGLAET